MVTRLVSVKLTPVLEIARKLPVVLAIAGLCLTAGQSHAAGSFFERLLSAPTFSKDRQSIPTPYNTPYDCRSFTGSGWKGIAGGRVIDFDDRFFISQAGCFRTKKECQAYLTLMGSYIDIPRFMGCRPYSS